MIDKLNYIKVEGRPDLVRDPKTNAILIYNYEKMNYSKNIKELHNKYNKMTDEIYEIKNNILEIKQLLLSKLNTEENNSNGNR